MEAIFRPLQFWDSSIVRKNCDGTGYVGDDDVQIEKHI